jgi:hypothetical protein
MTSLSLAFVSSFSSSARAAEPAPSVSPSPQPLPRVPGLDPADGVVLPPSWVETGRLTAEGLDDRDAAGTAATPTSTSTSTSGLSWDSFGFGLGPESAAAEAAPPVRVSSPTVAVSGYLDFGFFVPQGDGSGYLQDVGHQAYPQYSSYGWVFLGDILSPAVNSRGEVADLGNAPGVTRYDSLHTRGAPGFAVNELTLRLRAAPAPNAILSASVNFTPRSGSDFHLGDTLDVDIAQLEWLPTASQRTSIFVGKIESVLGVEYRDRKADARFGITPSLIARYTTGTALGLKLRSKFGEDDWFTLAVALTNGSNTVEQFHFYDEIDSNLGKTASGRASVRLPFDLELGLSGSYGAQDRVTNNLHAMWFWGPDLLFHAGPVDLKAAWLRGAAPGDETQGAYGLRLHGGGYVELDTVLASSLGVMARGEYRDAFVWLGEERAYVTKSWRATLGARWVFSTWAVLKVEALHNGEWGPGPRVRNDVFTSSLVLSY